MNKKQKTPEYTRRAIEKYHLKFARFTISTPREVKDRLNAVLKPGESANALINDLLLQEIERREAADTDLQEAKPQEATQDETPGARTNRHEATKSPTEGRTEAQEPKPRGRSRKASGATGGPEEGTTAGSLDTARREPVEDPETGTKGTDAPQPINPGDNLQNMLLYPYGMHDDIPPEELPFH